MLSPIPLPTTVTAFKASQIYCLDRHVGRTQAVRPDAKRVGLHK